LKGFLIRVGIDTTKRNIGYCAPVFPCNYFEYIPLPEFRVATSEKNTYGSLKARNSKYGEFLSDFMHEDRHCYMDDDESGDPFYYSLDENGTPLLAKYLKPHIDPEFKTNTFGDFWMRSGGRIPPDLKQDDYIFFYAGLSRYDAHYYKFKRTWQKLRNYQVRNKCTFLIGFFKIQKIFNITNEKNIMKYSSDIYNNAHYKFYEAEREMFIAYNFPTVIIKGGDESKLLCKAIQLNEWNPDLKKYCPTDLGRKIGLVPMSGMRIMKWLNEIQCKEIINKIKRNQVCE